MLKMSILQIFSLSKLDSRVFYYTYIFCWKLNYFEVRSNHLVDKRKYYLFLEFYFCNMKLRFFLLWVPMLLACAMFLPSHQ